MSEGNLNITPEMISNLANMIKNGNNFSGSANDESSDSSNNTSSSQNVSQDSFNNIDFETILKIKSIIENLNKKDDPQSNLLYSLKPYLRKSRQKKLDQYVNLLKNSFLIIFQT